MTNIFNGVPIDTNSAVSLTGNLIMFIKDYKYYIHNISANTTDAGVDFGAGTSILTQIPTGLVSWMTMRVIAINEIRMLFSDGKVYNYTFTISNNLPTFTFDVVVTQSAAFGGTGSYSVGLPISGEIDTGGFNADGNQWYKWDGTSTNTGGNCILTAFTYGGSGQDLVGLPSDLDSAYVNISNPTTGYAFKGSNYYELSFTNGVNTSEKTVGRIITGGTLVSSGTLPSASYNVFNGVPHNHQASGLFPSDPTNSYFFYYDGTINKVYKHNSTINTTTIHDIGSGTNQLFPGLPTNQAMDRALFTSNVLFVKWKPPTGSYIQIRYTNSTTASGGQISTPSDVDQQAATANNSYSVLINSANTFAVQLPQSGFAMDHAYTTGLWGGTTTPYTGLPQTGHRSMAMITGFNSMVNVFYDTGIVYTIDLSSQTVVASAQYGATVPPTAVDDKYWDLENDAVAKLNGVILPAFEIFQFTPNIIAGNYPQSGTAKEPLTGCAYYLNGTWSEWTQTSANVWAPSGNTLTFTSGSVNPGIDTNGAAYIGTTGGFSFSPNWASSPFTWIITPSNQVKITLNNGTPITFSPLADLPQPQNTFTAAQFESGLFSSSDVGTLTTSVLISNSVSSFKSPVFPREIDLTFLSESQVIIRRSWEIVDTTYTITSSNVLSGQYVSPTYPAQNNGTTLPDSYHMPTEWVVLANNDSQFFIEFSGGLNNTITSDGAYNMAVNPVGPSSVTYTWTTNYYTSADVLISPVVGFGATGSVSNFNITLTSVPASAEYILYVCTSSENVQAFASLVIIQAASAIPFVLDFQNQSAQIVTDATYTITPNPVDAGTTYAYTATYNNEFDASLGNVLGAVASGSSSSFNFVYANIPTGTKYINYTCNATGGNQGGETARLSISIIPQIPPTPQTFELQFNGGVYPVNITTNGNYSVVPFPTESALIITYTYTADYYAGVTKLGSVVGFDPTGQSSSFSFTFAGAPAGAQYIKFICTASGTGLQNGQSAESIIGLVSPSGSGSGDVALIRSTSGNIEYQQYNPTATLKLLTGDRLPELKMTLVDSYGKTLYTDKPIYYELEIRSSITKE